MCTKICAKERYYTHTKSCNSILYTKHKNAKFSELCIIYNVNSFETIHFTNKYHKIIN